MRVVSHRLLLLLAGLGTVTGCDPRRGGMPNLPVADGAVVPLGRIITEIKCEYQDAVRVSAANPGRLRINGISGKLTLSLSREKTFSAGVGVPIHIGPIKIDASASASSNDKVSNELEVPLTFDTTTAGTPADCNGNNRFGQPILGLKGLAEGIAQSSAGTPYVKIGSPLKFKGQFYLKKDSSAGVTIDVVAVKIDPAKVVTQGIYLQSFEIDVDVTGSNYFLYETSRTISYRGAAEVLGGPIAPSRAQPAAAPRPKQPRMTCRKNRRTRVTFCR